MSNPAYSGSSQSPSGRPDKTVRNIAIGIVAIAAIAAIGYFAFRSKDKDDGSGTYKGKIKVGHLVALDMAPLFVAKEAGYFEEEGLDVETVFFANPGDNNAALSGGSIQFSTNPFTLHYLAANSGVPIRVVSSAGGIAIMQVIAQGKHQIESLPALAAWVRANPGTKLKVAALRGDTLEMILYKGYGDVGLSYDNFEMVWFDDLLAMVEAFRSDKVDILSHIKPYTTDMVVNKGATVITDNEQVWGKGTPNCTVAVLDEFYTKYPKTVKGYLRAIYKGFDLTVKDPAKAVSLLEKGNYYKVKSDVLLYAFQRQPKEVVLLPNVDGVNRCIEDMVKLKYIKKNDHEIFYLDPLKQVLEELKAK